MLAVYRLPFTIRLPFSVFDGLKTENSKLKTGATERSNPWVRK